MRSQTFTDKKTGQKYEVYDLTIEQIAQQWEEYKEAHKDDAYKFWEYKGFEKSDFKDNKDFEQILQMSKNGDNISLKETSQTKDDKKMNTKNSLYRNLETGTTWEVTKVKQHRIKIYVALTINSQTMLVSEHDTFCEAVMRANKLKESLNGLLQVNVVEQVEIDEESTSQTITKI